MRTLTLTLGSLLLALFLALPGCGAQPPAEDTREEYVDPDQLMSKADDPNQSKAFYDSISRVHCIKDPRTGREKSCGKCGAGEVCDSGCGCCTAAPPPKPAGKVCRYLSLACNAQEGACACPANPEQRGGTQYFGPCFDDPKDYPQGDCVWLRPGATPSDKKERALQCNLKYCIYKVEMDSASCTRPTDPGTTAPSGYDKSECGGVSCNGSFVLGCDVPKTVPWEKVSDCVPLRQPTARDHLVVEERPTAGAGGG